MTDSTPYNPLDKKNLGASVAEALLGRKPHPLGKIPSFNGAGIYAIYYLGSYLPYKIIAEQNQLPNLSAPIYVGKAIPLGGRKGGSINDIVTSRALYSRLKEHAESVSAAENLELDDFMCRFLVVDDIWIPLGESLMIAKFAPLWNSLIDGFGNHDPGRGRYNGMRPKWDVLHPGRSWAERCQPRAEVSEQIEREVVAHLNLLNVPRSPHFYVEQPRAPYAIREANSGEVPPMLDLGDGSIV